MRRPIGRTPGRVVSAAAFLNALILGWSVSWPPGPVNAEMLRRGLRPTAAGGGFLPAWRVGIGACGGDFLWALSVAIGAGALLHRAAARNVLGAVSFILLLTLAFLFARSALRVRSRIRNAVPEETDRDRLRGGYWLGFVMALTSPFNIGFWFAVIGQQIAEGLKSVQLAIAFAATVVCGALMWVVVLCLSIHLGARFFAKPAWEIWTQAITALVMLYFALRLAYQLWLS